MRRSRRNRNPDAPRRDPSYAERLAPKDGQTCGCTGPPGGLEVARWMPDAVAHLEEMRRWMAGGVQDATHRCGCVSEGPGVTASKVRRSSDSTPAPSQNTSPTVQYLDPSGMVVVVSGPDAHAAPTGLDAGLVPLQTNATYGPPSGLSGPLWHGHGHGHGHPRPWSYSSGGPGLPPIPPTPVPTWQPEGLGRRSPQLDPFGYGSGGPGLPPVPPTPVPEWQPEGLVDVPPPGPPGSVTGWNPTYPPTPVPPPGNVSADCGIYLPPEVDGHVDPSIPGGPGGLSPESSPTEAAALGGFAGAGAPQAAPYPVPPALKSPPKPLCPPDDTFDYDWQSCWPEGSPPAGPPSQPYQHACKCPPGESWLTDENRCWIHGDPELSVLDDLPLPPGLTGGDPGCAAQGLLWDPLRQQCYSPCPAGDWHISMSSGECVFGSWCLALTESDISVTWKHLPGDCVGHFDDWESEVSSAMKWTLLRIRPAVEMLDLMMYSSQEYRRHLWNFGWLHDTTSTDPSLRAYFGEYAGKYLALIREALARVYWRVAAGAAPEQVLIRCHNRGCPCSSDYACADIWAGDAGRIRLCNDWINEDNEDERGRTMFHELLHGALAHVIRKNNEPQDKQDLPRDYEAPFCIDPGPKCYRKLNSWKLARAGDTEYDSVYYTDSELAGGEEATGVAWNCRAAVINVDNYVTWVTQRFEAFMQCTLPPGAFAP